jgi:hypothetical protein
VRVLIAYEDSRRVYADAMRHAIRALRPDAEVATCGVAELGAGVGGFDPDLVVSSRLNTVEPGGGRRGTGSPPSRANLRRSAWGDDAGRW